MVYAEQLRSQVKPEDLNSVSPQRQYEKKVLQDQILVDEHKNGPMSTIVSAWQQVEHFIRSTPSPTLPLEITRSFTYEGKEHLLRLIIAEQGQSILRRLSLIDPASTEVFKISHFTKAKFLIGELAYSQVEYGDIDMMDLDKWQNNSVAAAAQASPAGYAKTIVLLSHELNRLMFDCFLKQRGYRELKMLVSDSAQEKLADKGYSGWTGEMMRRLGYKNGLSEYPDFDFLYWYIYC